MARRGAMSAAATVGLAAACGLATSAPAWASAAPATYVSLGDSYTSVGTLTDPAAGSALECIQDADNYPHDVAQGLGLRLDDASCGGATTSNLTTSQYPGVPAQFDALSASTDVVTLGIGGNDDNTFITAVLGCEAVDLPDVANIGAPCQAVFGSTFTDDINADESNISAALRQIHALAPGAEVFVVGYPDILPQQGNCWPTFTLTTMDVAYLNNVELTLDAMLRTAAQGNGATYVDTFTPSIGHDACKSESVRWVEPIVPGSASVPAHPNAVGQQHTALDVEAAMRAAGIE